jgi:hypothetical protein
MVSLLILTCHILIMQPYIGKDKTHSAMNCLRIPNLAERCKFAESRYDQLKGLFELEVSI